MRLHNAVLTYYGHGTDALLDARLRFGTAYSDALGNVYIIADTEPLRFAWLRRALPRAIGAVDFRLTP